MMRKKEKRWIWTLLITTVMVAGLFVAGGHAQEKVQYGGTLTYTDMYPQINPMSWDSVDWNWKHSYDTGHYIEQLMVGDLQKGPRGTGRWKFKNVGAFMPHDVLRGELAQRWDVDQKNLRITFHLRKGVMWQERPGIMKAREFVADDVIYAFDRLMSSRKRIPQFHDFIKRIEAKDKHTVVFHLNEWNADWPYYIGHGYYNAIQAREQEQAQGGAGRWENACGTGPFMIDQYKAGHSLTYVKNPNYWDTELIGGKKYQIPFVDRAVGMLFKDPQTLMSALRTGRLDTVMTIGWRDMQELKRTTPQLIWSKSLGINATMIALRFDKKPFDDIRVRRALNMAINRKALSDTFAGGESVLVNVPFPYLFEEVYTPLEKLPPAARELFAYDPEKARKLLAEAGYPKGFSFKCTYGGSSSETIDFLSMIAANLSKIGVTMEINVMDYPSSISRMTKKVHDEGMLVSQDHATPLVIMRRMFVTGQTWNPSMISEKYIDDLYHRISTDRKLTDKQRNGELKKFGVYTLENVVPGILLSGSYVYTAWWPWVKNYHGELRVGIHRAGPIYARIWIDHELKKKMGY